MRRKFISSILTIWVLLMMPMTVFAQDFSSDRIGSISVTLMAQDSKTPITGAELSLYYVATVRLNNKNNLSYTFSNTFEDCGCALDDPSLSTKLDTFVKDNSVSAAKLVTDAHGNVTFPNLPLGLYFVKQTSAVAGYAPCTSFLVTVPNQSADGYVYDVNASPKTDIARLTDITIRKIWNTDASTKTADSVTVQLLRDETLLETARRMPDVRFVFAGFGAAVEKIAELPNGEYVGFKTGEELELLIRKAAVSVYPSQWYENCPFSVIESQMYGTPVIGSRMGGIPELILEGQTGELFEAGNAAELEEKLRKILTTPDLAARYSKNCEEAIFETPDSYYEKLMGIYGGEDETL